MIDKSRELLGPCAIVVHLRASDQVKINSALIRWVAIDLGRFLIVAIGTSWVATILASAFGYGDSPITGFIPRALVVALVLVVIGSPLVVIFLGVWAWTDRRVNVSRAAVIVGSLVIGVCFVCVGLFRRADATTFLYAYVAFLPTWLLLGFVLREPPSSRRHIDKAPTHNRVLGAALSLGGLIIIAGSLLDWAVEDGMALMYFQDRDGLSVGHGFLTLLAGVGIVYIGARVASSGSSSSFALIAMWLALLVLADLVLALAFFGFDGLDRGVGLRAPRIGMVCVAVGATVAAIASWRFADRFREDPVEA